MSSRKQKNKREYKAKRAARMAKKRREKSVFQSEGSVKMTREGYCFVMLDTPRECGEATVSEVFVKATRTKGALNGDRVVVDVTRLPHLETKVKKSGGRRGGKDAPKEEPSRKMTRCEGVISQITERSRKPFVGFLHIVGDQAWVLMQSKVMPYDIRVTEIPDGARAGYKVAAVVDDWPRGEVNPVGHIVDVLGEPGENDTEMHAILAEYGLPYRFEPYIDKAAEKISTEITPTDVKERKDFRKTLTFTIDPADAKDFDDALSYRKMRNGNIEVGVHIADVTHYVTPGTVIDKEAQERGTSVYLADRTVPMLPEKLSNNLCSLRPGEDKLTFSAVFEMTPQAEVVKKWFGRTIICSDSRMDYEQAQQIIKAEKAAGKLDLAVRALWELASQLRKRRFDAGAISFERPEMKVVCDEKGRPVDVIRKTSVEANWLIEEFMLLANRFVAEFVAVERNDSTFVYRIHDEPNMDKIGQFKTFVRNFGYKFSPDSGDGRLSNALNDLLHKARQTPEASAIELMALRCMAKARYDTVNIGHYGLMFKYYTHFTSPIRRYPDMMVHRLLAQYLEKGKNADMEYYTAQCKHASDREQLAADAERASVKYKMVEYMQERVGYTFSGMVSGLTEWGMYVEIEPTHIEGMVALRDIKSDFFEFDEEHYVLRGCRTGRKFTMGTPVRIKVTEANLEQKTIDFELLEG